MSTIDGSNHIDIERSIPKYKGFDKTAMDFAEQIDQAIGQYKDLLIYASEVSEEKESLQSQLSLAQEIIELQAKAIEFYGDPKSWQYPGNDFHDFQIAREDIGECAWISNKGKETRGRKAGKLARSTKAQVEKMKEGMK